MKAEGSRALPCGRPTRTTPLKKKADRIVAFLDNLLRPQQRFPFVGAPEVSGVDPCPGFLRDDTAREDVVKTRNGGCENPRAADRCAHAIPREPPGHVLIQSDHTAALA